MKLQINGTTYPVSGRPSFRDPVRFCIPKDKPDPGNLGEALTLTDDDGNIIREITVGGYSRWDISGDTLTGTNIPEPEPLPPTAPPTTIEDLENAMCELDEGYDARISATEDAICELDMAINGV